MRLQHLVIHSDRSVKLAALQALANMALNTTNQKEMEVSWWNGNCENLVKSMSCHWSCWKSLCKPFNDNHFVIWRNYWNFVFEKLFNDAWWWSNHYELTISFLKFITLTRSYRLTRAWVSTGDWHPPKFWTSPLAPANFEVLTGIRRAFSI